MNSIVRFLGAAAVALTLPACATVTRGTKETYIIESTPSAAEVALSTGETCVTPCKLKLRRKDEFTARLTKEGYQPAEAQVESKFKGGGGVAAAGNVLIGGVVGAVLDGTNGSLMDLTPNPLRITLIPLRQVFQAPKNAVPPAPVVATPAAVQLPQPIPAAAPTAFPVAPTYVQPLASPSGSERRRNESCSDYAERLFPSRSELRTYVQEKCGRGR